MLESLNKLISCFSSFSVMRKETSALDYMGFRGFSSPIYKSFYMGASDPIFLLTLWVLGSWNLECSKLPQNV